MKIEREKDKAGWMRDKKRKKERKRKRRIERERDLVTKQEKKRDIWMDEK